MIRSKTGAILFISGIFITLLIAVGAYLVYTKVIHKNARLTLVSTSIVNEENIKKSNFVKVAVAAQKILKHEELNDSKVKIMEVSPDAVPPNAVTALDTLKWKKTSITLEPNTILTDSMLYSVNQTSTDTDRLKDYEIPGGLVGGLVNEGQYIDIEFVNPKGTTYVVLAKKLVKKKLENNRIILQLSFEERQLINYALAEQKVLGGRLEAVIYPDERQASPKVNYPIPNLDVKQAQAGDKVQQPQPSSMDRPVKGGSQ